MEIAFNYLDCIFLKNEFDEFKDVMEYHPVISFESYICSQLHYDVLVQVRGRNICDYNSAYNFMCGRNNKVRNYKKVLKYYYEDLSNLVFSSDPNTLPDFSIMGANKIPRSEEIECIDIDIETLVEDMVAFLGGEISRKNAEVDLLKLASLLPMNFHEFRQKRLLTEALLMKYFINEQITCFRWR